MYTDTSNSQSDIPDLYTIAQVESSQDQLTTEQLKELSENDNEDKNKPLLLWIKKSTFSLTKGVKKKNLHVLVNVKDNIPLPVDLNDKENVASVDTSVISISKRIIDSKEYSRILSHDAATLTYIKNISLPGVNKKFLFTVNIADALSIQEWLDTRIKEREALVNTFAVEKYDEIIKSMAVKLGPLFSYSDYPSSDKIKNSFNFIYKFFSFEVPLSLRDVSLSLYKKEKERSERYWESLRANIRTGLVTSYQGLVDNFIENLSPAKDGKKKKFSKKAVDKMLNFINTFDAKNSFANFNELQELVQKSKQLMYGIDVDSLKTNADLSSNLMQSFSNISKEMSKFTENDTEEREYFFDDEETSSSNEDNTDERGGGEDVDDTPMIATDSVFEDISNNSVN